MNKAKFSTNRTEDAQLLKAYVSNRDEIALGRLIRKYENLVWVVCRRVLQDPGDVEDAFQATFLLLVKKARSIRKPKSIASWLYGAAYRTAHSIRRQRYRDHQMVPDLIDASLADDVLEHVARKNEIETVSAELMQLPEKYRSLLVQFHFVGESIRQIANTMGLTESATESRLKRGRRLLRHRLLGRGIQPFAALAGFLTVTGISVSGAVSSKTIAKCLTSTWGVGLWSLVTQTWKPVDQTGARLMILKSVVAFGIMAMMGAGAIMHLGVAADGPAQNISYAEPSATAGAAVVEIQEQESENDKSKKQSHAEKLHRHMHHHFYQMMLHMHQMMHEHHGHANGKDGDKESAHALEHRHRMHLKKHGEHSGEWRKESDKVHAEHAHAEHAHREQAHAKHLKEWRKSGGK